MTILAAFGTTRLNGPRRGVDVTTVADDAICPSTFHGLRPAPHSNPLMFQSSRRFEAISILDSGGMGQVLKVQDLHRGDIAAIKLPNIHSEQAVAELRREFKLLARIRHRNVVSAFELIEERGMTGYTMEFIDGVSLYDLLLQIKAR